MSWRNQIKQKKDVKRIFSKENRSKSTKVEKEWKGRKPFLLAKRSTTYFKFYFELLLNMTK